MSSHEIVIEHTGRVLAGRARWARTRAERRRGLLGSAALERGEALVIERAPQVHTFGMTYPIDVVFCSKDFVVKHVVRGMRPRRLSKWVVGARFAVELPEGTVGDDVSPGVRLVIR